MLDAAGDKEGYTKAAQRLKARREKYKAYCKACKRAFILAWGIDR